MHKIQSSIASLAVLFGLPASISFAENSLLMSSEAISIQNGAPSHDLEITLKPIKELGLPAPLFSEKVLGISGLSLSAKNADGERFVTISNNILWDPDRNAVVFHTKAHMPEGGPELMARRAEIKELLTLSQGPFKGLLRDNTDHMLKGQYPYIRGDYYTPVQEFLFNYLHIMERPYIDALLSDTTSAQEKYDAAQHLIDILDSDTIEKQIESEITHRKYERKTREKARAAAKLAKARHEKPPPPWGTKTPRNEEVSETLLLISRLMADLHEARDSKALENNTDGLIVYYNLYNANTDKFTTEQRTLHDLPRIADIDKAIDEMTTAFEDLRMQLIVLSTTLEQKYDISVDDRIVENEKTPELEIP